MLKKTIIGFMLALFAGPLSAHAEMPGQPCQKEQIGTTKMADDKQNIIACLVTGNVAPENVQEWKSMTAGSRTRYSLTCDDWKKIGWGSKDECIKDGRWHLVYVNNNSGGSAYGNISNLVDYANSGADVKSNTSGSVGGSHLCSSIAWKDGVLACMDTISADASDLFVTSAGPNDGTVFAGSALRRTDGMRMNTNIVPNNSGNMQMTGSLNNNRKAMEWYVRF